MQDKISQTLKQLRQVKPLVLCLTNYVTMDFMANSLLAMGAAPIMSCAKEELEELIKISRSLYINIGTLDPNFIERCRFAIDAAKHYDKPIILDPVGAGASVLRTQTAKNFMLSADIIRGNASEIMALSLKDSPTLGVEAIHQVSDASTIAEQLATTLGCTVVVSGQEDLITDGAQKELLAYGSPLMPLVTGMGCALTAVIAAFRAVIPDSYSASALASAYFSLCGSLAAEKTNTPGSFRTIFIDELFNYAA